MAKFIMSSSDAKVAGERIIKNIRSCIRDVSRRMAEIRDNVAEGGGNAKVNAELGDRAADVIGAYNAMKALVSTWSDIKAEDL